MVQLFFLVTDKYPTSPDSTLKAYCTFAASDRQRRPKRRREKYRSLFCESSRPSTCSVSITSASQPSWPISYRNPADQSKKISKSGSQEKKRSKNRNHNLRKNKILQHITTPGVALLPIWWSGSPWPWDPERCRRGPKRKIQWSTDSQDKGKGEGRLMEWWTHDGSVDEARRRGIGGLCIHLRG